MLPGKYYSIQNLTKLFHKVVQRHVWGDWLPETSGSNASTDQRRLQKNCVEKTAQFLVLTVDMIISISTWAASFAATFCFSIETYYAGLYGEYLSQKLLIYLLTYLMCPWSPSLRPREADDRKCGNKTKLMQQHLNAAGHLVKIASADFMPVTHAKESCTSRLVWKKLARLSRFRAHVFFSSTTSCIKQNAAPFCTSLYKKPYELHQN